jgi:hypothetical protein
MDPAPAVPSLTAYYYRNHATRVRELSAGTTTPALKEHHDVARQYDALADRADEVSRVGLP